MIKFNTVNDSNLRYILDHKNIEDDIIKSSENILVVFTQDWCPNWKNLNDELLNNKETTEIDIDLYTAIYNKSKLFEDFKSFKEDFWLSHLIPYLRYYKNGELLWETNHLSFDDIARRFNVY